MYWIHAIIVSLLLQTFFITGTDGNVIRRRRQQQQQQQQQQPSGSLYGNQISAANTLGGYNYPQNTNFYGTLNAQANKDQYGNVLPQQNQQNLGNAINTMGMNNAQQQQQQQQRLQQQQQLQPQQTQLYGASGPSGTNPLVRNTPLVDSNGYMIAPGAASSSGYSSSNAQVGYEANPNQGLNNKNVYNPATNTNNNNNNGNNQYGYNANSYPNSNTYAGQMPSNNNNNLWSNNQYNSNAGEAWMPNRDMSNNNNNNNNYNNHNALVSPITPYFYNNSGHHLMTSCFILLCSFLAISFFRM